MHPWPENDGMMSVSRQAPAPRGGSEYAGLHLAHRRLSDAVAGAALPPEAATQITDRLDELTALLSAYRVPEPDRHDGWRPDLPGRGMPLLPPYYVDEERDSWLRGRVRFTRFYLGGNGAAHGGAHPLLFDDVLGRVMNHNQPGVARTAYLKVNYRRVTPIDVELTFEVSRDRVEGRKRWGSGRLFDDTGAVLSDAEALFVQLQPGQA
jgi:hypothetical protein